MPIGIRIVVTVLVAFIAWRVGVELIGWPAIAVAGAAGVVTWLLLPKPAVKQ